MLRFMPEWWANLMLWMDTSTVPVWVVLFAFTLYFLWKLWRETAAARHSPRAVRDVYDRDGKHVGTVYDTRP